MGIKTTYSCDRKGCDNVYEDSDNVRSIGVIVRDVKGNQGYFESTPTKLTAVWCKKCIIAAGLIVLARKPDKPAASIILEDIVVEIVENELDSSQG